jgi:hypothetical protein
MPGPPAIEGNGGYTRVIQFNLAPIYKNTVVITMWLGWDDWINLIAHIIAPFQKVLQSRLYHTIILFKRIYLQINANVTQKLDFANEAWYNFKRKVGSKCMGTN